MNRKILALTVAVLTGLFIYSACTKLDTTDIGNDLIPAVDNVNTFDTVLDVITDNFLYPDSTRITGSSLQAIGLIGNDLEFGKTDAAAYFSVNPSFFGSTHPFLNPDSVVIDSVVLSIPFNTLYGDSNSQEQFEVYQIDNNSGFTDSVYRIDNPAFTVVPGVIGTKTVDFKTLNDSVFYTNYTGTSSTVLDSVRTKNLLRIKLDTGWARQFVNFDTANQYKTDSAFHANFKGLAVTVNQGASPIPNGLAYFSLTGTPAVNVTFYSRVTKNGQVDTIAPSFAYTNRASANLVKRTPGNNYLTYLNNGTNSDDKVYLQSSPGSVATIRIPGLPGLDNRIIHRAELILEKIPSLQDDIYVQEPILFVEGINESGDSTFTIRNDFIPTGQGTGYDVSSLEGTFKNNRYTFNLSRYVQSIVTKKLRSHTLRVYAPYATYPYMEDGNGHTSKLPFFLFINSPIGAYRVVVGGGNHPTNRMRLRIIYSKI